MGFNPGSCSQSDEGQKAKAQRKWGHLRLLQGGVITRAQRSGLFPRSWPHSSVCEPCLGRMVSSRSWGQGRKSLQETQSVATRKGKQPDFFLPPVPDLFPGSPTGWICQKPEHRAAWAHTVSMSQPHCIKHSERGTKNGSDIKQAKNDCHHIFSLILGSNPFF